MVISLWEHFRRRRGQLPYLLNSRHSHSQITQKIPLLWSGFLFFFLPLPISLRKKLFLCCDQGCSQDCGGPTTDHNHGEQYLTVMSQSANSNQEVLLIQANELFITCFSFKYLNTSFIKMLIPPSSNKTSVLQHSNHLMEKHISYFFFVLSLVNFQQIHFTMKWKLAFHLDASAPFGWLGSGQHPLLSTPTWGWHHHNGYTHRVLGGSYHLAHWPWTHGRWLVSASKGGRSWGILTPVCVFMCVRALPKKEHLQ